MAANRNFLAMTTGRPAAPVGGLRRASACSGGLVQRFALASTYPSLDGRVPSTTAGALALSLDLPIGCRA
jgi:hypothetical protein